MAGFRIDRFLGIRPRISSKKLTPGEAQTAQNAKLGSGDLRAWYEKDAGTAVDDTWYNRTIYQFDNAGSPVWFEWSSYVDVARGPVKDDSLERTYYTGVGNRPRMTYTTIADAGGGGPYPEGYYDLGVPAPEQALTAGSAPLPETLTDDQRLLTDPEASAFEIDVVEWTTYPGAGTRDQTWTLDATAVGSIAFDIPPGTSFQVKDTPGPRTVILVSASDPGIAVRTANADKTTDSDWHPMDEGGTTQEADFLGWRVPELQFTTADAHRLRVGDVIRITSSAEGGAGVTEYYAGAAEVLYEQSWAATPAAENDTGATVYRERNARVTAAASEGSTKFALTGEFYYEVDRGASVSSEAQDRQYVFTYVSALGEEGPPSPVSNVALALEGDIVSLTGFPNVTTVSELDSRAIDSFRIYRTNSSQQGTELQFVREYPTGREWTTNPGEIAVVNDFIRSEDLAETLQTETWFPPDENMEGITTWMNGMLVGFYKKTLFVSEPFSPHAWPAEYDQATDYDIIGVASFGNAIAVMTTGWPYILTGSHPRNLNFRPIKVKQACMVKESIATDNDRVYYASPDGLIELSVNGMRNVTEKYMEKDDWASYSPSDMRSTFHDGAYYGFFNAQGSVTQPEITAAITGTFTSALTYEDDIVSGAKTIIITLTGGDWEASGAAFNATRQSIIDSFVSNQSEDAGWNVEQANIPVTDVARTSTTVVTITLSALTGYSVTLRETLTSRLPTTAFLLAPADTIQADDQLTIRPDDDVVSAAMIAYASDSDAIYINDDGDYDGWERLGTFTTDPGGKIVDLQGSNVVAYDPNLDRWLLTAAAYITDGGIDPTYYTTIYSSDDAGRSWVRRYSRYVGSVLNHEQIFAYPEYNVFVTGNTTPSIDHAGLKSDNGLDWEPLFVDESRLYSSGNHFDSYNGRIYVPVWAVLDSAIRIAVSNDLRQGPLSDFWDLQTPVFPTAVDWHDTTIATGNGKILAATKADATADTELSYYDIDDADVDGDATWTSLGTITGTYSPVKMVYGGEVAGWCIVTSDFRVTTCVTGSEETIGSWTSYSSAKAAITVRNMVYDPGDGITAGWGFVVVGDDASNQPVVYTSTDGATWTLRWTGTATSGPISTIAFSNKLSDIQKRPI